MSTNRQFVSRIVTGGRFLSKDDHISWRYILNIGRTKAKFMMAQKLDELSLTREDGIKTYIPCVSMERISGKDCGIVEFQNCELLMRSCSKLPEPIFGKVGSSITMISSASGMYTYEPVTPAQWRRDQQRNPMYKDPDERKYYVRDGYLYTPGTKNELLDIEMITPDTVAANAMSTCSGSTSSSSSGCTSNWDATFICPERFLDLVVEYTIQEVAKFYKTSVPDENPNMDEHEKTKTTN